MGQYGGRSPITGVGLGWCGAGALGGALLLLLGLLLLSTSFSANPTMAL